MMACDCIERMNEALADHNACLNVPCQINLRTGEEVEPRVPLPLCKLDPSQRKRLPDLLSVYCPMCGQKYDEIEVEAQ